MLGVAFGEAVERFPGSEPAQPVTAPVFPEGQASMMIQSVTQAIFQATAFRILLPQILVIAVVGDRGNVTAEVSDSSIARAGS